MWIFEVYWNSEDVRSFENERSCILKEFNEIGAKYFRMAFTEMLILLMCYMCWNANITYLKIFLYLIDEIFYY